jgi:glycosyltransferase involved in cell wall biosynthesis
MRIAIDISQIIYGTGVSVYTQKLVESLAKIDCTNDYLLFGGSLRRQSELKAYGAKTFPISPKIADFIWNRLHILPIEKLIGKTDVFHSSDWTQPPSGAFKVTTVHDLIPIKFPKFIHPEIVAVHKRRLEWVKKEIDRVIVPSTQTKEDLIQYGISESKIRLISEAPVNLPVNSEKVEEIKRKYKIGNSKFLIGVGVTPIKNTQRIIKAFELASGGMDFKLILVGRPSNIEIEETRGVRLTGAVSNEELAALYSGAEALIYPSLYEGFGIPILDAFACSCPVVTSDLSSMAETAGDAAILVDPYSIDSIAEGIKKAIDNKKGLIEKGLRRIKGFSWTKTAEETLKVYQESK